MKNQVIKVLNAEHGEKVKEYFKNLGYDLGLFNTPNMKLYPDLHYGVIDGVFGGYRVSEILKSNAERIELSTNAETPKLNKKKVGRPKLTQEQKVRIAKAKARAKKRFEEKELSKNLNSVLSARIPTETYKVYEDAAKAKRMTLSEYLRDDVFNKNQPTQLDEPIPTETPKVAKVLTFDLSIYSNGKLSLYFECENYDLINNLMADATKLFSQTQHS